MKVAGTGTLSMGERKVPGGGIPIAESENRFLTPP
jgi:hypothetical protein